MGGGSMFGVVLDCGGEMFCRAVVVAAVAS